MFITVNSTTITTATKNKAAEIQIIGTDLDEMFMQDNIREDYIPQDKTFVFSTADTKAMNYLWKVIKGVKKTAHAANLVTKLDALLGEDIYLNGTFLQSQG